MVRDYFSIILLVFSINVFTAYYKYTQESGTNFFVSTADKSDALEDTNEVRQILDDLGSLLGHSKRDDLYPKNGTTGGYLGRLNYGIEAFKPAVPVVNDMYLATDTVKVYKCFVAGNWIEVYPGAGGLSNIVEDTTPQLGGDLDLNTFNISLTTALASDHTHSELTDSQPVGESVTFVGALLYFDISRPDPMIF
jgi:hypothetical protein